MVWIVEARPLPTGRGNRVFHLLRAELRQFWWLQPAVLGAGLGVWALLAAVTARVATDARPEGVVFNYMGSLLLSVAPLLLSGPAMTGLGPAGRLGFWLGLPLDRKAVNLLRILGPTLNAWPVILTWPLIIALLARVYGPASPWLLTNTALVLAFGILLAARTAFAPFLIYALLPVQIGLSEFIPGGRQLAEAWARGCASPWTGAALLLAVVGLAVYVLNARPRRKL